MGRLSVAVFVCVIGGLGCGDKTDGDPVNAEYLKHCSLSRANDAYALAGQDDRCAGVYAQTSPARIQREDIDVRMTHLAPGEFYSARARLDVAGRWVQGYYTLFPEKLSGADGAPDEIGGVIGLKLKTRESIDKAFGLESDGTHGICADVQQAIHDNVLNAILDPDERARYLAQGKKLTFEPDDDVPPLTRMTNPVGIGGVWLNTDPGARVADLGESVIYSPPAFYLESDDPNAPEGVGAGSMGVMYCKLLSHQIILHWMRVRSLEGGAEPLVAPAKQACVAPQSFAAPHGSCLFYFQYAETYYCADYTGYGFDAKSAEEKCTSREPHEFMTPTYSAKPCDQRLGEIAEKVPGYEGFQGLCIIHCNEEDEFLWNIYQKDPEPRCASYPYLSAAEREALIGAQ